MGSGKRWNSSFKTLGICPFLTLFSWNPVHTLQLKQVWCHLLSRWSVRSKPQLSHFSVNSNGYLMWAILFNKIRNWYGLHMYWPVGSCVWTLAMKLKEAGGGGCGGCLGSVLSWRNGLIGYGSRFWKVIGSGLTSEPSSPLSGLSGCDKPWSLKHSPVATQCPSLHAFLTMMNCVLFSHELTNPSSLKPYPSCLLFSHSNEKSNIKSLRILTNQKMYLEALSPAYGVH